MRTQQIQQIDEVDLELLEEEPAARDPKYCSLHIFDIETVAKSQKELEALMPENMKNPRMPMELESPSIPTLDSFVNRALKDEAKLLAWRKSKLDEWHAKHKAKIEKWQDESAAERIKFIESAALYAERCEVKIIGCVDPRGNYRIFTSERLALHQIDELWSKVEPGEHALYDYDSEQAMLESFWQYVLTTLQGDLNEPETRLGGFNSNKFDLPMLRRKSWIHCVRPTVAIMSGHYVNRQNFIDLLEEWQCGDRQVYISADACARALGLTQRKTGSGADFGKMWSEDKVGAILYNIADLQVERAIAQRMGFV